MVLCIHTARGGLIAAASEVAFLLFTANATDFLSVCKTADCASAGSPDSTILALQRGVVLSNCAPDVLTRVCIDVMVGLACIYFAITCALLMLKLSAHRKMAYRRIQVGTVFFRLQVSSQRTELCFFREREIVKARENHVCDVHNIMA